MSRYYQSSYHGSNDYKKYKEERLNAKDTTSSLSSKSPYQQTYNHRPVIVIDNKEHLQTFGQQDNNTHCLERQITNNDYPYQSRQMPRKSKYQNYELQPTLDSKLSNHYVSRLNDYSNAKPKPNYPSYSQTPNDTNETYQNTYRAKSNSRIMSRYEAAPEIMAKNDNFEDVIISRRKNFDYMGRKDAPNYKNCNYSSQLINPHQSFEADHFVLNHKNIQLKTSDQGLSRSKIEKRSYLNSTQTYQKADNIPSYQSRNELIRQRLNLNSHADSRSSSILRSNLKHSNQEDHYPNPPQRISKYVPPTHTTPQKTQLTPKTDRDLSEKRRKSLIEKSQMLKQKLNKLNTSSTKLQTNQDKTEEPMKLSVQNQNQNITSQGYTPPKRYLPTQLQLQLQSNCENQQPTNHSLSKKLDFDVNAKEPQRTQNCDTALQQSNRNYSRNYTKVYQRQPLQDPALKDQNPFRNSKSNNLQSNDGALKKIHELNQRINSRLQSILKNYG